MRRSLLALVLVGALLSACGDNTTTAPAATDPAVTDPNGTSAAAPVDTDGVGEPAVPEALDFEAPLVNGEQLDFRGYAGDTVALWFWAPT